MTRRVSLHRQLGLLAVGLILQTRGASGAGTAGNPFSQQQFLVGEVGPYGYTVADFREQILRPLAAEPNIAPPVEITSARSPIDGWKLGARGYDNVPFPEGNEPSMDFDTVVLYLSPNNSAQRDNLRDWSFCSAVWTMGLTQAALDLGKESERGDSFGNCGGMLPVECIQEMVAGFNSAGSCQNQTLPRSCAPFLAGGLDGVTSPSNLPQSGVGESIANGLASVNVNDLNTTFYAAVKGPLTKGADDTKLFDMMKEFVFPVVLSWTRKDPATADSFTEGSASETFSYVACVRAQIPGERKLSGEGIGSDASRMSGAAWLLVGALAACWAAVL